MKANVEAFKTILAMLDVLLVSRTSRTNQPDYEYAQLRVRLFQLINELEKQTKK